ncbi:MAG: hypothetical protein KKF68_03430 [Nanoarchaeota archaeon]|nr:hypothetical protein [Nanoarchaeota archaeon]
MKRYEKMTPEELMRAAIEANLNYMESSYERVLGKDTRIIVAKRQLDPSDPDQMRIGRDWLSKKD